MPAPDAPAAEAYMTASGSTATPAAIASAFASEKAAQARVCNVPADDAVWPADLVEALFRRIAHNLAVRALPLGVQASITENAVTTTRVGGTDAEVRRLEGPFRKRKVG